MAKPGESAVTVAVTKTTLAQILGTTKETLSRVLQQLHRHRILTYRGHQIRIDDPTRLQRIAEVEERL